MAVTEDDTDEQQAQRDAMIEEFRAARQRRLVKQGIALWNRTEARYQITGVAQPPPPEKLD